MLPITAGVISSSSSAMPAGFIAKYNAAVTPTGAVASWLDLSVGGIGAATQATPAKDPICTANQQNGKNTLLFAMANSTSLMLPSGIYTLANGPSTIFIVAKRNTEDATAQQILALAATGGANRYNIAYAAASGQIVFRNNAAGTPVTSSGNTNTNYNIITCTRSGVNQAIAVNGSVAVSNALATDQSDVISASIGALGDGFSFFLDGGIGELYVYPRLLSASELARGKLSLSNRWGIALV